MITTSRNLNSNSTNNMITGGMKDINSKILLLTNLNHSMLLSNSLTSNHTNNRSMISNIISKSHTSMTTSSTMNINITMKLVQLTTSKAMSD